LATTAEKKISPAANSATAARAGMRVYLDRFIAENKGSLFLDMKALDPGTTTA